MKSVFYPSNSYHRNIHFTLARYQAAVLASMSHSVSIYFLPSCCVFLKPSIPYNPTTIWLAPFLSILPSLSVMTTAIWTCKASISFSPISLAIKSQFFRKNGCLICTLSVYSCTCQKETSRKPTTNIVVSNHNPVPSCIFSLIKNYLNWLRTFSGDFLMNFFS